MMTMNPEFDRTAIRNWIEEATEKGLSVADSLPDTLVAVAGTLGMSPQELKIWCYDTPHEWTAGDLTRWARVHEGRQ